VTIPFLLGCVVCTTVILQHRINSTPIEPQGFSRQQLRHPASQSLYVPENESSLLSGLKVLVAIASFDFNQVPHVEEVLSSYRDLCEAGARVKLVIHTAFPYPVAFIDLLNSRLQCANPSSQSGFDITISVHSPRVRLHLVDLHRKLFYDNLDSYDLFIYSEDDIRVTPSTVASYLAETKLVSDIVGPSHASDFNVGIVRYEYNYPPDVVINDKTRFATANVTRVFWEHVKGKKPIIPSLADAVPHPLLKDQFLHMINHHQGMFLATRNLLKAWKTRKNCAFHIASERPGEKNNPSQPIMGTQRVWMNSAMLYSKTYCAVQQVLPFQRFGALTVHHLPNKNYRRVGKKGRIGGTDKGAEVQFADGSEQFQGPSDLLLTEMQLHMAMAKKFGGHSGGEYSGIEMVNDMTEDKTMPDKRHRKLVDIRMAAFEEYKKRGGIMAEEDMDYYIKDGLIGKK